MDYSVKENTSLFCEHLIVGSGPGGLMAARKLIDAGKEVMLIEEGDFVKTVESQKYKNYQKMNQLWRNGGITTGFGKISLLYAEGSAVGGGAEINSGIMQRAQEQVVLNWIKDNQLKDFSYFQLEKYYDEVFSLISPTISKATPSADVLIDGAKNLGWKAERLQLAYDEQGNKLSITKLFLDDLLQKGLKLFSNVKVKKINFREDKAFEIEALANKKFKVKIKFNHLFLAAGTIYSPFLLQKSGIKKSIGKSLQFHPTLKVGALFNHKINESPPIVPGVAITEFMPDIRIGASVFTKGFFGMFLSEDWQERNWMFNLHEYCGIYYAMIKPQGKARVLKLPFLPDPVVLVSFTNRDKELLEEALDKLLKSMFAAGAKFVYPSIYAHKGYKKYEKVKIAKYKDVNLMTIHAFSSLPMGEVESCPVDSYGKLKAVDNVHICDASIIPSAPGTNPQATIMALVARNMDLWIKKKL